jgi:hypothetical protein
MPALFSGSDRLHEFSLRVLTVIVVVAMVASAVLLLYRSLAPKEHNVGQPWSSMTLPAAAPAPAAAQPAPAVAPEKVLMSPEHVFRCDNHGRVTFSDRSCESGAEHEQVMPMTSPPHPGTPARPQAQAPPQVPAQVPAQAQPRAQPQAQAPRP